MFGNPMEFDWSNSAPTRPTAPIKQGNSGTSEPNLQKKRKMSAHYYYVASTFQKSPMVQGKGTLGCRWTIAVAEDLLLH